MRFDGKTIGLIEDDPIMGESLVQSLSLEGSTVRWWKGKSEAMRGLKQSNHDLVICDMRLPDGRGDELFRELSAIESLPPFIFITAFGDIDQAVSVMRAGAGDFLTKPFEMSALLERANALMRRRVSPPTDGSLGASDAMRGIEATLRTISDTLAPVLITGETGVGKEVCARFMHAISSRSREPFIAVNCAAFPPDTMERELFGYRGASGTSFHHGFAERARGGVLFLDGVSELPLGLQAKLLRLVDAREFNRVGGEQLIQFRARVVCSTSGELAELVKEGKFRADLFYRINTVSINVPPLREREGDIAWLLEHYLGSSSKSDERGPRGLSSLAIEMALSHQWPGNVRELRNRMERAVALTRTEWILPGDMFPDLNLTSHPMTRAFATLSEAREDAERRQIERALKQTTGQIQEAAVLLGVSRTTLWDKMRRLGIQISE